MRRNGKHPAGKGSPVITPKVTERAQVENKKTNPTEKKTGARISEPQDEEEATLQKNFEKLTLEVKKKMTVNVYSSNTHSLLGIAFGGRN
jgi:hypothetical protein